MTQRSPDPRSAPPPDRARGNRAAAAIAAGAALGCQSYARSLAVGDFNGDARADIAAASLANVSLRLGAGNGTFAGGADVPFSNPYPGAIAAGDFDGNQEDLAMTLNDGPSQVGVLCG